MASFPFVEIMYRMNRDVGSIKGAREQLVSRGLWNRLVFQYFCHNALTHRDIHERIAPAGEVVGYEVTLAMLNVGLSNGRLFKQLAIHLAEKGA